MSARDPGNGFSSGGHIPHRKCVCGHDEAFHIPRNGQRQHCGATVQGATAPVRCPCLRCHPQRPSTPDRRVRNDEGRMVTRITVQRTCNGCGTKVGDVTDEEMAAAILGQEPPDATADCPVCWAAKRLPGPKPLTQKPVVAEKPTTRVRRPRGERRA